MPATVPDHCCLAPATSPGCDHPPRPRGYVRDGACPGRYSCIGSNALRVAVAAAAAVPLTACDGGSGQSVSLLEYETVAPASWEARVPASSMRIAEFDAGDGAEVVVFYFGPGQGGSAEANVARWESQFTGPGGDPVAADVRSLEEAAFPTTVAELEGSYSRGVGMGVTAGEPQPGQALVAAVVESPRGSLFPQLFGPREAVAERRGAFLDFVQGIDSGGGEP